MAFYCATKRAYTAWYTMRLSNLNQCQRIASSSPKVNNRDKIIVMKCSLGEHIPLLLLIAFYMLALNVGTIWAPIKTFYNLAAECWCAEKYSVLAALRHFIPYRLKNYSTIFYPIWANMNRMLLTLLHKPLTRVRCIFKRCYRETLFVYYEHCTARIMLFSIVASREKWYTPFCGPAIRTLEGLKEGRLDGLGKGMPPLFGSIRRGGEKDRRWWFFSG